MLAFWYKYVNFRAERAAYLVNGVLGGVVQFGVLEHQPEVAQEGFGIRKLVALQFLRTKLTV